jgi:hypothetical protein
MIISTSMNQALHSDQPITPELMRAFQDIRSTSSLILAVGYTVAIVAILGAILF